MQFYRRALVLLIGLLLVIAPTLTVAQGAATITGTITYRERVTLPPDALVTLQIAEVTARGVAGRVIAEQTFATSGAQPPFRFNLTYNPTVIDAGRVYTLQGYIRSGGKTLFVTDGLIPVITGNAPRSDINVIMVAARSTSLPAAGSGWWLVWLAIGLGVAGGMVHIARVRYWFIQRS
ncbi:YbaY family lipoprotein [Chloroflexus sp.]|uniref:YbaY family lipoprotein n=1 Tax=Chloroflexus sp. TaxID=1904827 RepID=UPI00298EECB6|nr:YbaY family lipoprotein [Chloroflexus sp.]MDW8403305.1 YbaY family lipoprotein [Chloroflexus sp.]